MVVTFWAHTQNDGWCQEHRKQQNCLFFVFFHADISRKSHRGSSAPHISKHIWSCKVTWSKQHLALSVRISQFISSDKFTITESLFKIINIYRLKNKDDKKNKKVKKKISFFFSHQWWEFKCLIPAPQSEFAKIMTLLICHWPKNNKKQIVPPQTHAIVLAMLNPNKLLALKSHSALFFFFEKNTVTNDFIIVSAY